MIGAGNFGLTSDEFSFLGIMFGGLLVVVVPLYLSAIRQGRRSKKVVHEVTHNGGVEHEAPTMKDYTHGAYAEAFAARITAEEARRVAQHVETRLDDHIVVSVAQGASVIRRINEVENAAKAAIVTRDEKEVQP